MPALVNIKVGSFFTTIGADWTIVCPLLSKKSKNCLRISADVMYFIKNLVMVMLKNWFKLIFSPLANTKILFQSNASK
jgi:hypothetical protein